MSLTLDTSAIVALANRKDPSHRISVAAVRADPGPHVVAAGILAETAYMLEARLGHPALDAFLNDLDTGSLLLDCGEDDLPRIRELVSTYADTGLGFAGAAVAACAERRHSKVMTLDRRDFDILAGEIRFEIVP